LLLTVSGLNWCFFTAGKNTTFETKARQYVTHHTLIVLLHYLGTLRSTDFWKRMQTKYIGFTCTNSNESRLLTYCVSLWFLLNFPLNSRLFYVNMSNYWQRSRSLGNATLWEFSSSNTSLIGPDPNSSDVPQPGLLEGMGCHLTASLSVAGA